MTFTTEQSTNLAIEAVDNRSISIPDTIQTVIASMDADDTAMVNQTGNTWKFQYGSVEVIVNITGTESSDTFTVLSEVLAGPFKDEAKLMRLLLEKNMTETFEAHFAMQDNKVFVVSSRSIDDLSSAEISRIITIVSAIADNNDEALKAEFGAA